LTTLANQSTDGLDYNELEACISNRETQEDVRDDNKLATNNGVSATPTVFVNGDRIANWNNLVSVIENNYQ